MEATDILELKKDIVLPGQYIKAGTQRTREDWLERFPKIADWDWKDWFINLSELPPPAKEVDLKRQVVNELFDAHGLHSVSYKAAAVEAIELYLTKTGFPIDLRPLGWVTIVKHTSGDLVTSNPNPDKEKLLTASRGMGELIACVEVYEGMGIGEEK